MHTTDPIAAHNAELQHNARPARRLDAAAGLLVETRNGTRTRWFSAGPRGCTELADPPRRATDLTMIGDAVAIAAVLGGHLSPHDAEREGQIEVVGQRTHLNALRVFLARRGSACAA